MSCGDREKHAEEAGAAARAGKRVEAVASSAGASHEARRVSDTAASPAVRRASGAPALRKPASGAAASRPAPEDMTPDSILRELGYLSAVIRRSFRPAEGMGRPLQILVRLSLHEAAMAEGFAPRQMSQAELASAIGIRPQSVGPIVVRMEEDGLICRVPCSDDRRTILLELTEEGRMNASDARRAQCEFAEQTLAVLTDEERVHLAAAIMKLNTAVHERGDRL